MRRRTEYLDPVALTAWLTREADLRSDDEVEVIGLLIAQVAADARRHDVVAVEVWRGGRVPLEPRTSLAPAHGSDPMRPPKAQPFTAPASEGGYPK